MAERIGCFEKRPGSVISVCVVYSVRMKPYFIHISAPGNAVVQRCDRSSSLYPATKSRTTSRVKSNMPVLFARMAGGSALKVWMIGELSM
jgi:hypothetical protein